MSSATGCNLIDLEPDDVVMINITVNELIKQQEESLQDSLQ